MRPFGRGHAVRVEIKKFRQEVDLGSSSDSLHGGMALGGWRRCAKGKTSTSRESGPFVAEASTGPQSWLARDWFSRTLNHLSLVIGLVIDIGDGRVGDRFQFHSFNITPQQTVFWNFAGIASNPVSVIESRYKVHLGADVPHRAPT